MPNIIGLTARLASAMTRSLRKPVNSSRPLHADARLNRVPRLPAVDAERLARGGAS